MNKRDSVKVYLNDEVVDLRDKNCSTRPGVGNMNQTRKQPIKKGSIFPAQTRTPFNKPKPPLYLKKPQLRPSSMDPRFRRLRTATTENLNSGSRNSLTNLVELRSASEHSLTNNVKEKTEVLDLPPNDDKPNRTLNEVEKSLIILMGGGEIGFDLEAEELIQPPSPPPEPSIILETESFEAFIDEDNEDIETCEPDFVSTFDEEYKSINTSEEIDVCDKKTEHSMSQYWDDPRLSNKYNELMQAETHPKVPQPKENLENENVDNTMLKTEYSKNKRSTHTYKYIDEDTDCDTSISTTEYKYGKTLFWLFYIFGTSLGILIVSFLGWLVVEKNVLKLFRREEEEEGFNLEKLSMKVLSSILGPIVFGLNRTIKFISALIFYIFD